MCTDMMIVFHFLENYKNYIKKLKNLPNVENLQNKSTSKCVVEIMGHNTCEELFSKC